MTPTPETLRELAVALATDGYDVTELDAAADAWANLEKRFDELALRYDERGVLLTASEQARQRAERALEDMVRQFAYECQKDGRPAYGTGGLSALEDAFGVLGWDDPHPALDRECEIAGCHKWATCGTPTDDGYRRVCGQHYSALAPKEKP